MIRQYVLVFILALIAAVFQSTLLGFMGENFYLDLIFVIAVLIGLFKDPVHGSIMTTGVGYLEDLLTTDFTGLYMTARLVTFFAAQFMRDRLSPNTPLAQFAMALGLGFLDRMVVYTLHEVFRDPLAFSWRSLGMLLVGTFINAALVPIFYFLFRWIPGFIASPGGPRLAG